MTDQYLKLQNLLNVLKTQESLIANNDHLKDLTSGLSHDQIKEAELKAPNIFKTGAHIPAAGKDEGWALVTYKNKSMEGMLKFAMTAVIGYMFKTLDEYKAPPTSFLCGADLKAPPPKEVSDDPEMLKIFNEKQKMLEFMEYIFDFDPNRHIGSAIQFNVGDPQRVQYDTKAIRKAIIHKKNRRLYQDVLITQNKEVPNELKAMYNHIPSIDNVLGFEHYVNNMFDSIIQVTNSLYSNLSDITALINVHKIFKTKEEAEQFSKDNNEYVFNEVNILPLNSTNVLGPYAGNKKNLKILGNRTNMALVEMIHTNQENHQNITKVLEKKQRDTRAKLRENKTDEEIEELEENLTALNEYRNNDTYKPHDDNNISDVPEVEIGVINMNTGERIITSIPEGTALPKEVNGVWG